MALGVAIAAAGGGVAGGSVSGIGLQLEGANCGVLSMSLIALAVFPLKQG